MTKSKSEFFLDSGAHVQSLWYLYGCPLPTWELSSDLWRQTAWVQIVVPSFISCVSLERLVKLSIP